MPAAMKLCRDAGFVHFALTATLRRLQEWEASELTAAIATGTGQQVEPRGRGAAVTDRYDT